MTDAALRALSVVWMVARILTGEIGVIPQAAPAVAQVAYNRLDAGMGYDGWNAIADEPTDWALDAAWEAHRRGGDRGGDLFALSDADCEALGVTWGTRYGDDRWGITTTRRWPK